MPCAKGWRPWAARRRRVEYRALALLALLAGSGCVTDREAPTLAAFEATLFAHDSATRALGQWCARHEIADPATIRAVRIRGGKDAARAGVRAVLAVEQDEPLGFRHVRLVCGGTVLSEARNWYVPSRLAPEMNRALDTTDTPFGAVAGPLGFTRARLASHHGAFPGCPPDTVLSQRGLLRLPDGRPLALLEECYAAAILASRRGD